ncbi:MULTISPECIES: metalloregulator ArsR/SmtB family transcription factor [Arthrobacter]|uniref:Metalloregulator ArsR/SmtB family transcription factor n=2 Tax=Arthrobacter TaxID=1663 RepID=A0ABU9KNU2_9MICC|nr:metalloregulator ArsR/SmtB family transcription factor [Arthrobacter sp. YJM1]MDP5227549.1 metalloregulator ArsR/SmtB family transcription factor [Arthrobacter sp. YJM1]
MVVEDIFAVIAEPTRREILQALRSGDRAVGELVEELETSQPTVSKHLRVLREAGLVSMRAQGQKRYYSLEREPLLAVQDWVGGLTGAGRPQRQPAPTTPGHAPAAETVPRSRPASSPVTPIRPGTGSTPALRPGVQPGVEQGAVAVTGQQLGRAATRAATRAAEVLANLPKLGRKK